MTIFRLRFQPFTKVRQIASSCFVTGTSQTLPVLPPCRASSAEDLQEEAISDQLALLERLQPAAGQRAAVAHLARPRSGAAVRTAARLHLLCGPRPAQGCHGEPSTGHRRCRGAV